jgi:hypothetical protein
MRKTHGGDARGLFGVAPGSHDIRSKYGEMNSSRGRQISANGRRNNKSHFSNLVPLNWGAACSLLPNTVTLFLGDGNDQDETCLNVDSLRSLNCATRKTA